MFAPEGVGGGCWVNGMFGLHNDQAAFSGIHTVVCHISIHVHLCRWLTAFWRKHVPFITTASAICHNDVSGQWHDRHGRAAIYTRWPTPRTYTLDTLRNNTSGTCTDTARHASLSRSRSRDRSTSSRSYQYRRCCCCSIVRACPWRHSALRVRKSSATSRNTPSRVCARFCAMLLQVGGAFCQSLITSPKTRRVVMVNIRCAIYEYAVFLFCMSREKRESGEETQQELLNWRHKFRNPTWALFMQSFKWSYEGAWCGGINVSTNSIHTKKTKNIHIESLQRWVIVYTKY